MHMSITQIYGTGLAILIGAILINMIATFLGIATWYSYIHTIRASGFLQATKQIGILSIIFLYVIYPTILGYIAHKAM